MKYGLVNKPIWHILLSIERNISIDWQTIIVCVCDHFAYSIFNWFFRALLVEWKFNFKPIAHSQTFFHPYLSYAWEINNSLNLFTQYTLAHKEHEKRRKMFEWTIYLPRTGRTLLQQLKKEKKICLCESI